MIISRVALTVKDLARSIGFYEKVLNFKRIGN
ncbi:VOC family protein, partial [Persicitalea sp.]